MTTHFSCVSCGHLNLYFNLLYFVFLLFQYMTYEDCLKEALSAAENCRTTNESQLAVNIYEICDEYQDKLKTLCVDYCAKGM